MVGGGADGACTVTLERSGFYVHEKLHRCSKTIVSVMRFEGGVALVLRSSCTEFRLVLVVFMVRSLHSEVVLWSIRRKMSSFRVAYRSRVIRNLL